MLFSVQESGSQKEREHTPITMMRREFNKGIFPKERGEYRETIKVSGFQGLVTRSSVIPKLEEGPWKGRNGRYEFWKCL